MPPARSHVRDEDLAALLAASPPRRVPATVKSAALRQGYTFVVAIFGLVFALLGTVFVVFFFPIHFLSDWRLSIAGTTNVAGVEATGPLQGAVTQVVETRLEINDRKVWGYDFQYSLGGQVYQGSCYTTGKRWFVGQRVPVQYLPTEPQVARIAGARLSKGGNVGWFSPVFPLIGLGIAGGALRARRNTLWLLERGRLAEAQVESVERTGAEVDYKPEYKVTLRFAEGGLRTTVTIRYHSPELVTFAETRLQSGQPVFVLYDPDKPTRLIIPEALS